MLHWHAMVCVAEDLGRLVHERRRLAHGRVETTHVVVHDDGFFFFSAIGICKLRTRENVKGSFSLCCRSLLLLVGVYLFVTALDLEGPIYNSRVRKRRMGRRLVVLVVVLVWGREKRGVCVLSKVVLSERYGNDSKLQVSASAKCKQQESSDFRYLAQVGGQPWPGWGGADPKFKWVRAAGRVTVETWCVADSTTTACSAQDA